MAQRAALGLLFLLNSFVCAVNVDAGAYGWATFQALCALFMAAIVASGEV